MKKQRNSDNTPRLLLAALLIVAQVSLAAETGPPSTAQERMVEWTITSRKAYADPFNDVEVDVIFTKDDLSWRVPTFWRGDQRWSVRFAPPRPGDYLFHLESTDKSNPDLNGHDGRITIRAYSGDSDLLRHGALRVSANRRFFEHADGKPFYWLGDTWWTGLSSRLSWEGFQRLTADRRSKGFTVVQLVAGLVPNEEVCPGDAGCQNEGGAVWDAHFGQINPHFFDYADRRIEYLINAGMVPAIVGAWSDVLDQTGVAKMKAQWRYLVARYGAYPVLWIVGGEVFDPPSAIASRATGIFKPHHPGAWSEVARYLRQVDPYHHPMAAHEMSVDDPPLQQESLTDFRLFQPSHFGWPSIAVEVTQLNLHYARTAVTKPLVVGEIGYEKLGGTHLEDFQRVAFWLAMLNGAAGHTYGAAGTWESYTTDKPFQRTKRSLLTWEDGMALPGSYQIGLGAKLLRRYSWWRIEPHPEWITPHGTTLLEPRGGLDDFHIDVAGEWGDWPGAMPDLPQSEWAKRKGNFRLPYAAGIPREVRLIYLPTFGVFTPDPPTVLGLEPKTPYHAYYWEPSSGITVDLGVIERPESGPILLKDSLPGHGSHWKDYKTGRGPTMTVTDEVHESNLVASVEVRSDTDADLVLRFQDINNYVAARYSHSENAIYLIEHQNGSLGKPLGRTAVSTKGGTLRLTAELRGPMGAVSLTSAGHTSTTPIVTLTDTTAGRVGIACDCKGAPQRFENLEVRESPTLVPQGPLQRRLYDAAGQYQGELAGSSGQGASEAQVEGDWDHYGTVRHLLLDAYRPEDPPTAGDWLLVLEASHASSGTE